MRKLLFAMVSLLCATMAQADAKTAYDPIAAALPQKSTRFLAAIVNNDSNASTMIERVLVMDFESGSTRPSDWSAYAAELSKYRLESAGDRGSDILISMLGAERKANKCRDRLLSWLRPAAERLELTFSVQRDARCPQPLQVEQVFPAEGGK